MIHEHGPEKEHYKHLMGHEKRAHEGSQSKHPQPVFGGNAEYGSKTMHSPGGTMVDKADSDRGNPRGLADADE